MKTGKLTLFFSATISILSFQACEKWGQQMDPPAANDKFPRLEQVSKITFEDVEEQPFDPASVGLSYYAYEGGSEPEVVDDEEQAGKVLHLSGGYARMTNPLGDAQNGVSLTFLARQAVPSEEPAEGGEADTKGALFSFENANATQRMYLTADGRLVYDGVDGSYDSGEISTGMLLDAGPWRYVAVTVRNDGYSVFVDGRERIDRTVLKSKFDFSKIVRFMGDVPYIYMGYGADVDTGEMWIDDLAIYRNQITAKEQEDPRTPGDGGEVYERYLTVGAEDNTTGYFSATSPHITMNGNGTLHLSFVNHSKGAAGGNYNNWAVAVDSDASAHGRDDEHYFILRADNWENISGSNANITNGNIPANDAEWTVWRDDMNGANVDMTITRNGNTITLTSVITTTGGKVWDYGYTYTGQISGEIVVYLVTDMSHYVVDRKSVYISQDYTPGSHVVGNPDNSSPYYGAVSDLLRMKGDNVTHLKFINYTSGISNWNNWNIVVSNDQATGVMGGEYIVLRADLWENVGGSASKPNITGDYDFGDNAAAWAEWRQNMNGAIIDAVVERAGDTVTITGVMTATSGSDAVYNFEFLYINENMTDEIVTYLTTDGSHFDVLSVSSSLYWSPIKE